MDVVVEARMGRIFYRTIDIGRCNSANDNGDQIPIEWMMGQDHIFLGGNVR